MSKTILTPQQSDVLKVCKRIFPEMVVTGSISLNALGITNRTPADIDIIVPLYVDGGDNIRSNKDTYLMSKIEQIVKNFDGVVSHSGFDYLTDADIEVDADADIIMDAKDSKNIFKEIIEALTSEQVRFVKNGINICVFAGDCCKKIEAEVDLFGLKYTIQDPRYTIAAKQKYCEKITECLLGEQVPNDRIGDTLKRLKKHQSDIFAYLNWLNSK